MPSQREESEPCTDLVACGGVFGVDWQKRNGASFCYQSAVVLCRQPHWKHRQREQYTRLKTDVCFSFQMKVILTKHTSKRPLFPPTLSWQHPGSQIWIQIIVLLLANPSVHSWSVCLCGCILPAYLRCLLSKSTMVVTEGKTEKKKEEWREQRRRVWLSSSSTPVFL